VRNAAEPEALPLRGADVLETEMTTGGVALQQDEDPHAGGASAAVAAGLSPETGGGRGLCPGTGTINLQGLFHDQGAAPGLQTGSRAASVRSKGSRRGTVICAWPFHVMDLNMTNVVIFVLSFLNNQPF